MINKEVLASYITQTLNQNEYGIVFDIKADRNEYENAKLCTQSFVVPGVVLTGMGTREPTSAVDIYYQNLNVELFAYACMETEGTIPPFTYEEQLRAIETIAENLNAQTEDGTFFEEENGASTTVFFETSTVSVGGVTNYSGGGYTRIPLLWQIKLTIVSGTVFFNTKTRTLTLPDSTVRTFAELNMALTREQKSFVRKDTVVHKTVNLSQKRVFNGSIWYKQNDPLLTEFANNNNINQTFVVNFDGATFNCVLTDMVINGADGGIVSVSVTLTEKGA